MRKIKAYIRTYVATYNWSKDVSARFNRYFWPRLTLCKFYGLGLCTIRAGMKLQSFATIKLFALLLKLCEE